MPSQRHTSPFLLAALAAFLFFVAVAHGRPTILTADRAQSARAARAGTDAMLGRRRLERATAAYSAAADDSDEIGAIERKLRWPKTIRTVLFPDESERIYPGEPWIALIACASTSRDALMRAKQLGAAGAVLDEACDGAATASVLEAGAMPAWLATWKADGVVVVSFVAEHAALTLQARDSSSSSTSMIILYTITGCVSALFCIVIVTGVIRAVRHPERYARSGEGFTGGAGGTLTRAIIDTFPVIKFHSAQSSPTSASSASADDAEKPHDSLYEMGVLHDDSKSTAPGAEQHILPALATEQRDVSEDEQPIASPSSVRMPPPPSSPTPPPPEPIPREAREREPPEVDPIPDQIGRETCPICIVDFEEGDDLRVLPCEGQHRFHQTCVDPWLLELSTSCPICRQDLQALQDIIAGEAEDGHARMHELGHRRSSGYGRFSRYLRFVRRRQRGSDYDATDPPMPMAPESSY